MPEFALSFFMVTMLIICFCITKWDVLEVLYPVLVLHVSIFTCQLGMQVCLTREWHNNSQSEILNIPSSTLDKCKSVSFINSKKVSSNINVFSELYAYVCTIFLCAQTVQHQQISFIWSTYK